MGIESLPTPTPTPCNDVVNPQTGQVINQGVEDETPELPGESELISGTPIFNCPAGEDELASDEFLEAEPAGS